jgi:c-di-GMP-binding flagellar brake protein YcgR
MIEDMHLKGMRVSLNKRLPQPGPVKMSFAMGNNFNPIDIEAQVSWAKEDQGSYRYGLSFSKINDEDKDRIYRFISTICYDQFRKKWWA